MNDYPGRYKAMEELLNNRWVKTTFNTWLSRGHLPSEAWGILIPHLREVSRRAAELADAAEAEKAIEDKRVRRVAGCCAVDPLTGRSKRSKIAPHRGVAARERMNQEQESTPPEQTNQVEQTDQKTTD